MGIAEDLSKLKDLRDTGGLSEQEFERAKAAVLNGVQSLPIPAVVQSSASSGTSSRSEAKPSVETAAPAKEASAPATKPNTSSFLDPAANARVLLRLLLILGVGGAVIWFVLRLTGSEQVAKNVVANVIPQARTLIDRQTYTVTASSAMWIPFDLPYRSQRVFVEYRTLRGNPLDAYLIKAAELENFKRSYKGKGEFSHIAAFNSDKAKSYRRDAVMPQGGYYLVLLDPTLGILSDSESEVEVMVRIDP